MRSACDGSRVVIGITSIVGMTSSSAFRSVAARLDQPTRPNTSWCRVGGAQLGIGKASSRFAPARTSRIEDAARSRAKCPSVALWTSGSARWATIGRRIYFGNARTKQLPFSARRRTGGGQLREAGGGTLFLRGSRNRRQVVVLRTPWESLFPNVDPIGKTVRIGAKSIHCDWRARQTADARWFSTRCGRLRVIPYSAVRKVLRQVLKGAVKMPPKLQSGSSADGHDRCRTPGRRARRCHARGRGAHADPP